MSHVNKSQNVGLVLSGGGASGLCHVGVLKALEENKVPINYVCGTSIGALIGAYYAIGYTPAQIEELVKSYFFLSVTRGEIPTKYEYMIKQRNDFAAWLTFKYDFKNNYIRNLPTNLINSMPIDYYLMETFTSISGKKNNKFDSLMIPFRCLASDVELKKTVVFKDGDLPSAIRASMTYPFYMRPITVEGQLLFDGGLYNNFPADVMQNEFNADFIIGSNVAEKTAKPDDENLYLQLRTLMTNPTNFSSLKNGLMIEPWSDVSSFNFDNVQRLIDSGYTATMRLIPQIKLKIARDNNGEILKNKRSEFKNLNSINSVVFDKVDIIGFNSKQSKFIQRSLFYKQKPFTMDELRKRYFRLACDDKIKNLYPVAVYDSVTHKYTLKLSGKKEKPFYFEPGAIVSNRPISEVYLGLQYNYLGKVGLSVFANGYSGKLYSGTYSRIRLDIPGKIPISIEPSFTYSRWDYFSSSVLFYDFLKPAYLIQEDKFGELKVALPVGNISQFNVSGGYTEWRNQYYQSDIFSRLDTADVSYFDYWYLQANYQLNTLNRKMYATEGTFVNVRARYLEGNESYYPGNTSLDSNVFINKKQSPWFQFKFTYDGYYNTSKRFKFGLFGEAVYSTQGFFSNYQSTILSAPAFNPTPESKTFFMDTYRAHNYLAGGIKTITSPFKNIDLRLEAYIFQPVLSIISDNEGKAQYSSPFLYRDISAVASIVYNSPIGPVSASFNYYDKYVNPFSFFFHVGYIIFNRKSID